MTKKPFVVAIDGPDCSRKTTVVDKAKTLFEAQGRKVVAWNEPGGASVLDKKLRRHALSRSCGDDTRRWLMLASHCETQERLRNCEADIVLLDRYGPTSAYAYQVCGLGAPSILTLAYGYVAKQVPNMIFIALHGSADEQWEAMHERQQETGETPDAVESKDRDYHGRVYQGFRELADNHRHLEIEDSSLMAVEVWSLVNKALTLHVD